MLRTRFAPTPSGYLHKGNAYSFILTWLVARSQVGKIVLRIDDLDSTRKRADYVNDVFESLEWLGLDYDEGPQGPDEFEAKFSQTHRIGEYNDALVRLREAGLLFACECTRKTIQQASDGKHPIDCKTRQTSLDQEDVAWRIATSPEAVHWTDDDGATRSVNLHQSMRDFVVRRKDKIPAYQLASLIDDKLFDINYVVRGADLLDSTAAQRILASHLESNHFMDARFLHHALLTDTEGAKLSKSDGASSLKMLRESESTPSKLYQELSSQLGLSHEVSSAAEALSAYVAR